MSSLFKHHARLRRMYSGNFNTLKYIRLGQLGEWRFLRFSQTKIMEKSAEIEGAKRCVVFSEVRCAEKVRVFSVARGRQWRPSAANKLVLFNSI